MFAFMSGIVFMGFLTVVLIFLKFWMRTKDRFFGIFSVAFVMISIERLLLILTQADGELRVSICTMRLVAFLFIIGAVYDKNRASQKADDRAFTVTERFLP